MRIFALGVFSWMAVCACAADDEASQGSVKGSEGSKWMDIKVEESHKIFTALAQGDFNAMTESTRKLKTLSALEGFIRRGTPGYRTQLSSFEFAVDEIEDQAKQKNLEGATMGFHQLTMSCVNCHKQIRSSAANSGRRP